MSQDTIVGCGRRYSTDEADKHDSPGGVTCWSVYVKGEGEGGVRKFQNRVKLNFIVWKHSIFSNVNVSHINPTDQNPLMFPFADTLISPFQEAGKTGEIL